MNGCWLRVLRNIVTAELCLFLVILAIPRVIDCLSCAVFCAEYAQLFAALIARTAKDIDVLIDSLPSEESTAALQVGVFLVPVSEHS